jgi:hypothetical protein
MTLSTAVALVALLFAGTAAAQPAPPPSVPGTDRGSPAPAVVRPAPAAVPMRPPADRAAPASVLPIPGRPFDCPPVGVAPVGGAGPSPSPSLGQPAPMPGCLN